jgi:hypothetical protein
MEGLDPSDGAVQTHVDEVGGPLELENGRLLPLVQEGVSGKVPSESAHHKEQHGYRQQQKYDETLLEGGEPKSCHETDIM